MGWAAAGVVIKGIWELAAIDLSADLLLFSALAVFLSAVVRGFSGFGLAALLVTGLTLILPAGQVVPIALLLELLSSLVLAPKVWRQADWPLLRWFFAGALLGTPIGLWSLKVLPASDLKMVISVLVLLATLFLWRRIHVMPRKGPWLTIGIGVVSGFTNGVAALGGLPFVIYLLAIGRPAATVRATVTTYLLIINVIAAGAFAQQGVIDQTVLLLSAVFTIPVFVGIALGHRLFARDEKGRYRPLVLLLLSVLALIGLSQALFFD